MTNNQNQPWDFSNAYKDPRAMGDAAMEVVSNIMPLIATTRVGAMFGGTVAGRVLMGAMPAIAALGIAAVVEVVSGRSGDALPLFGMDEAE